MFGFKRSPKPAKIDTTDTSAYGVALANYNRLYNESLKSGHPMPTAEELLTFLHNA